MFTTSSQCKYWMFNTEDELNDLRKNANLKHVEKYGEQIPDADRYNYFLNAEEEKIMVKKYEHHLRDFCKRFQPPMPRCVAGTSFHYFKRFYINNSVMNYHPKEIMVTCIYLACKVEEFNVSIMQFVANIREGLLIDIKTRCSLNDPERLRPGTEHFLEKAFLTDAVLLYSPSQVALAAVLHAASKLHENLDAYVTDTLFGVEGAGRLEELIEAVRSIRSMVKMMDNVPDKSVLIMLERKLDKCRNPENNPDTDIYKKKILEMLDEEDDLYHALSARNENLDNSVLTMSIPGSPYSA
ncbi:hypothetical protein HHI36_001093 [Cryptolaemus montrouzieri]|uniref:Cyclin-like domain-containing protein n=1 Tax=Cryptolaemus montrouzieri TaxID=559131 RepID=A0ABD2P7B6_9CUCU